jgi:LPXTG-site transpeptidase (sortase) family protein
MPAGESDVVIGAIGGGEAYARRVLLLRSGTAYTVMWLGGGETALVINAMIDGVQPADPPAPDVPINTGVDQHAMSDPRSSPKRNVLATDPTQILAPVIGVNAPVVRTSSSDAPNLPSSLDGQRVAWFSGTNRPGEPGIAVMAGHVVYGGEAVFTDLARIKEGDTFTTIDANDHAWHFTVRSTIVVRKGGVPPDFYAPTREPTVVLVSCTGDVDAKTGLRKDNILVVATAS